MPSLPTSLILVGLVVAWIVVLVPMVAKRREHVPENHEDGAGFRILQRRGLRARRRPVLSRTAMARGGDDDGRAGIDDDSGNDARWGDGEPSDEFDDDDGDRDDGDRDDGGRDDGGRDRGVDVVGAVAGGEAPDGSGRVRGESRASVDEFADDVRDDLVSGDDEVRRNGGRGGVAVGAGRTRVRGVGEPEGRVGGVARDAADDWEQEHAVRAVDAKPLWRRQPRVGDGVNDVGVVDDAADVDEVGRADGGEPASRGRASAGRGPRSGADDRSVRAGSEVGGYRSGDRGESRDRFEPSGYRAVPVRSGRGGFDPRAAERARAYRFRQRRRVALVLLALTAAGVPVGIFGMRYGWAVTGAAGVLLVLYLAYLRRQVRIEDAIRQRRAARLERSRQIRPGYRPSVAEQVYAHRTGEMPRVGADYGADFHASSHVRPTVPPSSYRAGEPVDFEDSDPAFDDLEYYRPAVYRRRAG